MLKIRVSKLFTIASFSSYNEPCFNIFSTLMVIRKIHNTRKQNQLDEIFLDSRTCSLNTNHWWGRRRCWACWTFFHRSLRRAQIQSDRTGSRTIRPIRLISLAGRTFSASGTANSDRYNEQSSMILIIHSYPFQYQWFQLETCNSKEVL